MTVRQGQRFDWSGGLRNAADIGDPFAHRTRDINPGRWRHSAGKPGYFVLPETSGRLTFRCGRMRRDIPHRLHRHAVHVAYLGQGEDVSARPPVARQTLAIDPLGGIGVPADFHVLRQLFVPDSPPLGQESLDLFEHEGVALNGGGVMGLLVPDGGPDALGFKGSGRAPEALPHLGDGRLPGVDRPVPDWDEA